MVERRIYILSVVAIALAIAALMLPRVFAQGDEGMAAAATAAMTFLLLIGLSAVTAAVLAVITWMRRAVLSPVAIIAGTAPLVVVAAVIAGIWLLARG